ncbi:MAG: 4a-hydroxytetrahydrobiopterin dehydratase [Melioribacteraceae bacterium]|nr:4a-hydroxytetrahydrobiopterin dehydratase [Melioribacteraceae bacterium]
MKRLSPEEINNELITLNGWIYNNNSIEKGFIFKDFADALSFIIKCGIESEKADHHPDLLLHSWNKVKITLSTHSEGGVTTNDIKLAQQIEKIN